MTPYRLISMNLKKAFDRVSHNSIDRALKRFRLHSLVRDYMMANYFEASTTISCGGMQSRKFQIKRGVKEGDPMSPCLLNLVMGKLLTSLPTECGLAFGDTRIAALAYADDLVLLARSRRDDETLLRRATKFFKGRGL